MTGPSVLAVELTDATIAAALLGPDGHVSAEVAAPVACGAESVHSGIRSLANELIGSATGPVLAAGIAAPVETPLDQVQLAREFRLPLIVTDNARAAAEAERTLGVATGVPNCAVITIDTRITAASITGDRPVTGATGRAGQLSHLPVRPGGDLCECGELGCLVAYASTGAIPRRYAAAAGRNGSLEHVVNMRDLDPIAALIWREAVTALATALTALTLLQDPELIVLGGPLATLAEPLFEPLREAITDALGWREPPRIEPARFGTDAPRLGAALLAWHTAGLSHFASWQADAVHVPVA